MRLLTRTYHLLRNRLRADVLFTTLVVSAVACLEVLGRFLTSDLYDAFALGALALLVLLVVVRHRQTPLSWVTGLGRLARQVGRRLSQLRFEIGLDLRGEPPVPVAFPSIIRGALVLFPLVSVLLLLTMSAWPEVLRTMLTCFWYTGYLLLLGVLWSATLFCILLAVFIPTAMIHDAAVGAHVDQRRRTRGWEFLGVMAYFVTLGAASLLLPPWVPLVACFIALLANLGTIFIPTNPHVQFIWRYHGQGQLHAVPWARWVTGEFSLVTLLIFNLVLLTYGSQIVAGAESGTEIMPITTRLGMVMNWLAPGALCALVLQTILGRLRDPARPAPPVAHITGCQLQQQCQFFEKLFAAYGWQVSFPPVSAQTTDVSIVLTNDPYVPSPAEIRWPLVANATMIGSEEFFPRLKRRDEVQRRRRIMSGLELLFKRAARRRYRNGSGFWVAPHYWFISGLSRDTHEEEVDLSDGTILTATIGPSYHRVIPRAARHHLYQIFRALQIDLIFVEDGVGFRRFVRVLRMMFEIYDVYGGKRRADEMHFQGLPGLRVLIHDYQLTEPFKSDKYPEPDYENLGRARILHVFRDRGEQPETLDTPQDFSHLPAPSLAY